MAVKRKYRLNLRNYGNLPAIMLSQYDEGYALEFEIRDGTDAASDLSAYTVTLKGTRADTLAYSFAGTISTNVLTFVIDTTMTACAGRGTAEIAIKDTANDVLFATFNMPVFVERAAVPEGSIDADVERAQEIAEQVQEIVDNAAAEVKGEAESWAVGQRDGTDVPATDPTYHNNAKYYSEQAQQAADSIGIDATLTQSGKAADAKKTGDEITALKEDLTLVTGVKNIEFTPNYYIKTNIATGNVVDLTPVFNRAFSYAIVPVLEGQRITLHAWGWTTGRLWAFITDENVVVSVSGQNINATSGLELTAPANATKLIINSYTESLGNCYVGEIVPDIAVKANSAFNYADSNVIIENETLTADKTFVLKPDKNFYKNIIVSVDAEYTAADNSKPTLQAERYWLHRDGIHVPAFYGSPDYVIGDSGKRKTNQFRFPGGVSGMVDYVFIITVPAGCTLTIHSLSLTYDDFVSRNSFIQLNAHGLCGYGGCANTNVSFNMAARLGYKYCITIPKVTSDGIYVCFHDDANIQGQAKNPDGTDISSEYQNIPISGFTYDQLLQFDFGIYRGMVFAGEKIPLLSDFFKICAESGMHPMLSIHPDLSGHWNNIKVLAKKYNVLDKLNIKAPVGSTLSVPMSTLLNDVESYTVDINDSTTNAVEYMNLLKSTYNLDETKVKLGIEFFDAYATDEKITAALDSGYFVSIANINRDDVYNKYTSYIEKGVTQFTDDYCPNVGINWY